MAPTIPAAEGRGHTNGAADAALSILVNHALLSQAASLARKGEYAAAERILQDLARSGNESPAALDLLARSRAQ